ncbi:MAG: hypothetical protein JWL94_17 [Microbacteriaceae bacterium]|jgi:uncharacterized protein (DUF305 family)|nr:hypothetical protein [Microbacteriaceae bacterium]HEV7957115.1 DUF305 domain-containing protein [Marisediminicola sp.]
MFSHRIPFAVVGVIATAIALTACSSPSAETDAPASRVPSDSAEPFNDPDVTFVTMMIPHHEQAVDMSQMILDKEGIDPRVSALAAEIEAAQGPEIDTMKAWLDQWGVAEDDMAGMDHGMDGMMSEDDMADLDNASGTQGSRLFLEQMMRHHEGAIAMAQTEIDEGQTPDAVALAERIIAGQTSEIAEMQKILSSL